VATNFVLSLSCVILWTEETEETELIYTCHVGFLHLVNIHGLPHNNHKRHACGATGSKHEIFKLSLNVHPSSKSLSISGLGHPCFSSSKHLRGSSKLAKSNFARHLKGEPGTSVPRKPTWQFGVQTQAQIMSWVFDIGFALYLSLFCFPCRCCYSSSRL
jgi:hypothetical protein